MRRTSNRTIWHRIHYFVINNTATKLLSLNIVFRAQKSKPSTRNPNEQWWSFLHSTKFNRISEIRQWDKNNWYNHSQKFLTVIKPPLHPCFQSVLNDWFCNQTTDEKMNSIVDGLHSLSLCNLLLLNRINHSSMLFIIVITGSMLKFMH